MKIEIERKKGEGLQKRRKDVFVRQTDCQTGRFPISMRPMKRLLPTVGAALLAIALVVQAEPQDELYATYYGMMQDAETLQAKGEEAAALIRYREVQEGLQKLNSAYPSYNPTMVKFRLEYVTQKIAPLAVKYPNVKALPKPAVTTPKPMPAKEHVPAPVVEPSFTDSEITRLHDQLISLQTEKIMLQKQLKDALSAKPAAVDPKELAKAEASMLEIQKERDVLKATLQQEQAKAARMVDPKEVTETRAQLSEASKELAAQKKAATKLADENASLEKRIASMRESKELPMLKDEVATLRRQLAEVNKTSGNAMKLETENRALAAEASKLKAENSALKDSSKKMGDLAKLETENRTLAAEATRLKAQSEALEEQLKAEQKRAANMAKAGGGDEALKKELTETQKRLAEQQKAVEKAREGEAVARAVADRATSVQAQLKAQADEAAKLRKENAKLEALLTDPNGLAPAAAAPAMSSKEMAKLEAKVRDLEKERDSLEKKLKEASSRSNRRDTDKTADQLAVMKAELEVLKATKTPYTKEELALFKAPTSPTTLVASVENRPATTTNADANANELSAASRKLMAEGERAANEKRYDVAVEKYEEVLKSNGNHVFTLGQLAAVQMEQNKLSAAEKNLDKALSVKKDDAYSLSLKGIIKFREEKYDEALTLLSQSAKIDPNSADTQNFLGITLSQKGQRGAAEAALRKAIQIAPGNANAHHNLAVVYATQNPPMTELARWHYQKARGYGHPVNAELEKLLAK
ncbi:MAG: repeat protein [Verrucomicrobia bacterium]|jgi:Flp pilus assembly protein TadD|nr:repeat protein [Verrucomicrobiota bacterium]